MYSTAGRQYKIIFQLQNASDLSSRALRNGKQAGLNNPQWKSPE